MDEVIARINELAHKAKNEPLTEEELIEILKVIMEQYYNNIKII